MISKDSELLAELGLTADDIKLAEEKGIIEKTKRKNRRQGNWWQYRKKKGYWPMPPLERADEFANVMVLKSSEDLKNELEGKNSDERQVVYGNHIQVLYKMGKATRRGFLDIRETLDKVLEMGKLNKKYFNAFYQKRKHANK